MKDDHEASRDILTVAHNGNGIGPWSKVLR